MIKHLRWLVGSAASICFITPFNDANASPIVALRTPTTIVLGADSRVNSFSNSTGVFVRESVADRCKIGDDRNLAILWAAAGYTVSLSQDFDVYEIAAQTMRWPKK